MRFSGRVRPPNPDDAFAALWTRDGAKCFSAIQKYTSYEKESHTVRTTFRSFGATIRTEMIVLPRAIFFDISAPFVKARGQWTLRCGVITLEQTVSCPFYAVPIIRRCVKKTLKDLVRI